MCGWPLLLWWCAFAGMAVWGEVVGHCSGEELGYACTGLLMIWLCLAAASSGGSVDPSLLTQGSQVRRGEAISSWYLIVEKSL